MKPLSGQARLNAICPYYTMFPLSFPLGRLRGAKPGEWVLDPFCGRGTTIYAARLLGLPSIGLDSNPVAAAIAEAKLLDVTAQQVVRAAKRILAASAEPQEVPRGDFWQACYHPTTLRELCVIREALLVECRSTGRKALRALLLGRLHGPLVKGEPSYLSNQMPRTYAAKPAYAVRYWRVRSLRPPKVDLLELVRRQASYYFADQVRAPRVDGYVACADSRSLSPDPGQPAVSWIITSPPYYGMRSYIPDQWLRYWFLGGPADVAYRSEGQLRHQSPEVFATQLSQVWRSVAGVGARGARMVIRFGGIHDRQEEPRGILLDSIRKADCGWKLVTARSAGLATAGKRQASQFKRKLAPPVQECDFYARLAN